MDKIYTPCNGRTLASEKSKYKYFNVSLCGLSAMSCMGFLPSPTYHEERLHLIVVLRGDLVDIENGRIPAALHATVLFDRLEYSPTVIAVADVSGQPERDK